jgi:hypothetical protein
MSMQLVTERSTSASSMRKADFARPDVAGRCPLHRCPTTAPRDRPSLRTLMERRAPRCKLVSEEPRVVLANSAAPSKGQDADRRHHERGIGEGRVSVVQSQRDGVMAGYVMGSPFL